MKLYRLTNGYLAVIFTALFIFMAAYVMKNAQKRMEKASGITDVKPLDLAVPYDGIKAYQMLADYGAEGRAVYRTIETREDVFYPVIYFSFFFFTTLYFLKKAFPDKPKMGLLICFIVLVIIFDATENTCIVLMIDHLPQVNLALGNFAGKMTLLKWIFLIPAALSLLFSFIAFLATRARNKKQTIVN